MGMASQVGAVNYEQPLTYESEDGVVTADKIRFAVERIVEKADPLRVIAFGSRARGDHRVESDLDLAVVVDEYDPKQGLPSVRRSDVDVWMTVDLIVYGAAREALLSDSINSVQFEIKRDGVVLYDRASGFVDSATLERLV